MHITEDSYEPDLEKPILEYILSRSNKITGFDNLHRGLCLHLKRIYSIYQLKDTIYRMKLNYKVVISEDERSISVTSVGSSCLEHIA